MRKNFLLLFLMALLPLAGWAQTDLSSVTVEITLNRTQLDYTGKATAPVITALKVDGTDALADFNAGKMEVQYYNSNDEEIAASAVRNAGDYKLALKGVDSYSKISEKVPFTINKGELSITLREVTEKTYGDADPTILEYTWDNESQLKGDDDVNNVILDFSALQREKGEDVGEYAYTTPTATTANYNVTVNLNKAKLKINKATLIVTYDSGNDIVKNYGEANPALDPKKVTYTGWTGAENTGSDDAKTAARNTVISALGTLGYTQNETNANADKDGKLLDGIKEGYALTPTAKEHKNYTIEFGTNKMLIKQVVLAATPDKLPANGYFTYAIDGAKTNVYSAADWTPKYNIVYVDAQANSHTLDADQVDYSYKYSATEDGTFNSASDKKTAGYYKATVTAKTTGNYSGTLEDVKTLNHQITKKDLYVYVKSASRVYDGTATDVSDLAVEYNGLQGKDKKDESNIKPSCTVNDKLITEMKDADSYPIAVAFEGSTLATNYNISNPNIGTYEITKRRVKVTAKSTTVAFGTKTPTYKTDDEKKAAVEIAAFDAKAGTGVYKADKDDVTDINKIISAIAVAIKAPIAVNVGETSDIEVTVADATKAPNYEITGAKGTFGITGAGYTIIAENVNLTYGDPIDLTDAEKFPVLTNATPKKTVAVKLQKDGKDVDASKLLNVGTYDIVIVEDEGYAPDNYSETTYVPGVLTIAAKALTVTMDALSLNKGATDAVLQGYKGKVHVADLVEGGDKFEFALAFNTKGENSVTVTEGKLASDDSDKPYAKGLKVTTDYAGSNYDITAFPAYFPLTVLAENVLVLDPTDADMAQKISDVKGKTMTVKFGEIEMAQKEWHAMVLPFTTTPKELVAKLESYVVINKLVSSTIENGVVNVKFGLEWDEIKAGEPFLIKVSDKGINWYNETFSCKSISTDINPAKSDYATFTGTYASDESLKWGYELDGTTENAAAKYQWLAQTSYKGKNKWLRPTKTAHELTPMEAYLVLASEATGANIFVEDFENGFTAIKSLSTDQVNGLKVAGEGWYTLNGVKLQGAPTQKGIYINNGKKVVIK